jgi:hypothetical protein
VKALGSRQESSAVHVFSLFTALISALFVHSAIESVSFAVPCIIFGFLSGMQQWERGKSKPACHP